MCAGGAKLNAQGSAAATAELSYWQLLTAQYGSSTADRRLADSPHGLFLLSAAKAHQLVVHLAKAVVMYQGMVKCAADPSTMLASAMDGMGLVVADFIRHGLYGIKALDSRQLALLMGLALDGEARRHVPESGGRVVMCFATPGHQLCNGMNAHDPLAPGSWNISYLRCSFFSSQTP